MYTRLIHFHEHKLGCLEPILVGSTACSHRSDLADITTGLLMLMSTMACGRSFCICLRGFYFTGFIWVNPFYARHWTLAWHYRLQQRGAFKQWFGCYAQGGDMVLLKHSSRVSITTSADVGIVTCDEICLLCMWFFGGFLAEIITSLHIKNTNQSNVILTSPMKLQKCISCATLACTHILIM